MTDEINFCQRCGGSLSKTIIEGKERPHCHSRSVTIFSDPKVVAAVLIEMDDRLVMIRRANEPGQGLWSFPSGFVDRGETVETAAIRPRRIQKNCKFYHLPYGVSIETLLVTLTLPESEHFFLHKRFCERVNRDKNAFYR